MGVLVVGFSGPQGSGKTTLMNGVYERLKSMGVDVGIDTTKVSRLVQSKLGWDNLGQVLESYDTMFEFQKMVADEKCSTLPTSGFRVILSERTFCDITAYYRLWSGKFEHKELDIDWIHEARLKNNQFTNIIYVPFMEHIVFEYDPQRGFKNDITKFDNLLLSEFMAINQEVYRVKSQKIDDRVEEVAQFLLKELNDEPTT